MANGIEQWLAAAAQLRPYYSHGIRAITPVEMVVNGFDDKPTLAVDKHWRLYWSQEALDRTASGELVGLHGGAVILHELEHLLRDHAGRATGRDPMVWNIACDAEINDEMIDMLPGDATLPKHLKQENHLTAESYYASVPAVNSSRVCGGGSGVDGVKREYEKDPDGETPSVDQTEAEQIRDAVANDVLEAAKAGLAPAGLVVWANAQLGKRRRVVDPITLIRGSIRRSVARVSGAIDYTYSRLSRRQDGPVIIPSLVAPVPLVAMVIDTSGSMHGEGDKIAAVIKDVTTRCGADVVAFDVDCQSYGSRKIRSWRDARRLRGGGGTDLRPAIKEADELRPALIVVATDCETPWPSKRTVSPMMIVQIGNHASEPPRHLGRVVRMQ